MNRWKDRKRDLRKSMPHGAWVKLVMAQKSKRNPTLADPGRRPLTDAAQQLDLRLARLQQQRRRDTGLISSQS
jgi:hypothetical protein